MKSTVAVCRNGLTWALMFSVSLVCASAIAADVPSALLRHGVYQTAERDAPKGAKVAIYPGAYKAGTDYSAMKPVKETTVARRWVLTTAHALASVATLVG